MSRGQHHAPTQLTCRVVRACAWQCTESAYPFGWRWRRLPDWRAQRSEGGNPLPILRHTRRRTRSRVCNKQRAKGRFPTSFARLAACSFFALSISSSRSRKKSRFGGPAPLSRAEPAPAPAPPPAWNHSRVRSSPSHCATNLLSLAWPCKHQYEYLRAARSVPAAAFVPVVGVTARPRTRPAFRIPSCSCHAVQVSRHVGLCPLAKANSKGIKCSAEAKWTASQKRTCTGLPGVLFGYEPRPTRRRLLVNAQTGVRLLRIGLQGRVITFSTSVGGLRLTGTKGVSVTTPYASTGRGMDEGRGNVAFPKLRSSSFE